MAVDKILSWMPLRKVFVATRILALDFGLFIGVRSKAAVFVIYKDVELASRFETFFMVL